MINLHFSTKKLGEILILKCTKKKNKKKPLWPSSIFGVLLFLWMVFKYFVFCSFYNRIPDCDNTMSSLLVPQAFRLHRHEFTPHQDAAQPLHKEISISQYASHRSLYLGISRHCVKCSWKSQQIWDSDLNCVNSLHMSKEKWSTSISRMNNDFLVCGERPQIPLGQCWLGLRSHLLRRDYTLLPRSNVTTYSVN